MKNSQPMMSFSYLQGTTLSEATLCEPAEMVKRKYSLAKSLYRMQEMAKVRASRREARRREVLLDPTLKGEYR